MSGGLGEFTWLWLLTALSPGPTAVMIMSQSLRGRMRAALRGLLGLQAGHLSLFLLLALGLGAAGHRFQLVLPWLQRAGAAYLIFTAVMIFRGLAGQAEDAGQAGDERAGTRPAPTDRYFLESYLTHVSNPKAVLFTFSLLPAYLRADEPLLPGLSRLAAIMLPIDFIVMGGYAWMADRGGTWLRRHGPLVSGLSGLMLLYVGVRILLN